MSNLHGYIAVLTIPLWLITLPLAALWLLALLLRRHPVLARTLPLVATALKFLVACTVIATIDAMSPRNYFPEESGMNGPLLAMLVNHLWQSTLFAAVILGLALLLRRNSARIRYSLWLAASLKFLVPFAALAALGTLIPWHAEVNNSRAETPRVLALAGDIAAPMASDIDFPTTTRLRDNSDSYTVVPVRSGEIGQLAAALLAWALGATFITRRWLVRWFRIRRTLHKSVVVANMDFPTPVRATAEQLEPGMVGVFRPKLLLPAGIEERLTAEQMQAVLAHERHHLRWRDNLTASLHMVVEAVFWFFPPVWWIGARLVDERERDCDEQVVRDGHLPESYAEGVLNVCEHYVASRLPCVSGISGSDLRRRIESILKHTLSLKLDRPRQIMLAAMACCTVAAPIVAGAVSVNKWQALLSLNASTAARLEYALVRNATVERLDHAYRGKDPHSQTCPSPTPTTGILRMQKSLATTVKRLGPHDERALLYAIVADSPEEVRRLLKAGALWNTNDSRDDAHHHDDYLAGNGLTPMLVAATFGDERMLDTLVSAGLDINAQGTNGMGLTPLMTALYFGQRDNAEWLLRHGADVNITSATGANAIASALRPCVDLDMVERLLRAGALPNDHTFRFSDKAGIDLRGDQPWQTPARRHAEVIGDFDGDGTPDHARLLASADGRREGLFVQLSSQGADRWIHATEANALNTPVPPIQVTVVMPGAYKKDDKACDRAMARFGIHCQPLASRESPILTLARPGIRFVPKEGAVSIIHWNAKDQRFERTWITD